jgi:hypothetical protein
MTETHDYTDAHRNPPGSAPPPVPPAGAPGQPFPYVPPPRGEMPPAGLSYGYAGPPGPGAYGPAGAYRPPGAYGPPGASHFLAPPVQPGPVPPAPQRRNGRTVLIAVLLSLVLLGGIGGMVALAFHTTSSTPAPTQPAVPPAPTPDAVPSTHHTLNTMFNVSGNGTCSPISTANLLPSTSQGIGCTGTGTGPVFLFYQYTGTPTAFQTMMMGESAGTALTLSSQDACSAKYTGTINLPDRGPSPIVIDVYKRSPFVAVSLARTGQSSTTLLTPQYRAGSQTDLCAGG